MQATLCIVVFAIFYIIVVVESIYTEAERSARACAF